MTRAIVKAQVRSINHVVNNAPHATISKELQEKINKDGMENPDGDFKKQLVLQMAAARDLLCDAQRDTLVPNNVEKLEAHMNKLIENFGEAHMQLPIANFIDKKLLCREDQAFFMDVKIEGGNKKKKVTAGNCVRCFQMVPVPHGKVHLHENCCRTVNANGPVTITIRNVNTEYTPPYTVFFGYRTSNGFRKWCPSWIEALYHLPNTQNRTTVPKVIPCEVIMEYPYYSLCTANRQTKNYVIWLTRMKSDARTQEREAITKLVKEEFEKASTERRELEKCIEWLTSMKSETPTQEREAITKLVEEEVEKASKDRRELEKCIESVQKSRIEKHMAVWEDRTAKTNDLVKEALKYFNTYTVERGEASGHRDQIFKPTLDHTSHEATLMKILREILFSNVAMEHATLSIIGYPE